jgi:tetratricopeptide (TPR) repeat protein
MEMPKIDWYRRETWTEKDQQEFFERLGRSRTTYNKAQYLRIQAYHLKDKYPEVSNQLLDKLIEEYPEKHELASAYLQKAMLMIGFGRNDEAIDYFQKSIQQEREYQGVKTTAYLEYGKFVAVNNLKYYFEEILGLIEEFGGMELFPSQIYAILGIRAIIYNQQGHKKIAKQFAEKALECSCLKHSGLPRHPNAGLVEVDKNIAFHKMLKMIVRKRFIFF